MLETPRYGRALALLVAADAIAVNIAFWLSYQLRFLGETPTYNWDGFRAVAPWLTLLAFLIFYALGLYHRGPTVLREDYAGIWVGSGLFFLLGMGISYAGATYAIPRTVFMINVVLQGVAVSFTRFLVNWIAAQGREPRPVHVLGPGARAEQRGRYIREKSDGSWEVRWHDVAEPNFSIEEFLRILTPGSYVVLDEALPWDVRKGITLAALERNVSVLFSPSAADVVLLGTAQFTNIGDLPFLVVRPLRPSPDTLFLKRIGDLVGAVILIVVTLPVTILAAILVKLSSPGSVFFRQERVGLNGATFSLFKFRTMVDGAEDMTGPILARKNDPRITPVGKILRSLRIDELPQLLNVLRGEMSLVGPRPERPEFVREFEAAYPEYRYRHLVKPGLTGLAQVIGNYDTPVEEKLRLDLLYLRNHGLTFDLKLLLWTLKVVVLPERAAGVSTSSDTRYNRGVSPVNAPLTPGNGRRDAG